MTQAVLGIGANLGDPASNVRAAVNELSKVGTLIAVSDLYASKPWGITDQPDFVNAVAIIDVKQSARELLRGLKSIEDQMGRTTRERWGPRVIDIDILFFGDESIADADLIVPHPRWAQRAFVLKPLSDLRSEFLPFFLKLPERERLSVSPLPQA